MSHLPEWTLVIIRSVFILIILFTITKCLGKRQISQLSFFEYIAGMTIGDIAAQISTGLDQSFSMASSLYLFSPQYLFSLAFFP